MNTDSSSPGCLAPAPTFCFLSLTVSCILCIVLSKDSVLLHPSVSGILGVTKQYVSSMCGSIKLTDDNRTVFYYENNEYVMKHAGTHLSILPKSTVAPPHAQCLAVLSLLNCLCTLTVTPSYSNRSFFASPCLKKSLF
jgi:hypothetical protein